MLATERARTQAMHPVQSLEWHPPATRQLQSSGMPSRVIYALLALIMCCLCCAALEEAIRIAPSDVEQLQTHRTDKSAPRDHAELASDHGSDPRPAQVQAEAESAIDFPGLLSGPHALPFAFIQVWPRPPSEASRPAPYLDGPHRPPRSIRPFA